MAEKIYNKVDTWQFSLLHAIHLFLHFEKRLSSYQQLIEMSPSILPSIRSVTTLLSFWFKYSKTFLLTLVWFHGTTVKISPTILEPWAAEKVFCEDAVTGSSQPKLIFLIVSKTTKKIISRKEFPCVYKDFLSSCIDDDSACLSSFNRKFCVRVRNCLIIVNTWWKSETFKRAPGREKRCSYF